MRKKVTAKPPPKRERPVREPERTKRGLHTMLIYPFDEPDRWGEPDYDPET